MGMKRPSKTPDRVYPAVKNQEYDRDGVDAPQRSCANWRWHFRGKHHGRYSHDRSGYREACFSGPRGDSFRGSRFEEETQTPPGAGAFLITASLGGSHYWGREIQRIGHEVKLIAPTYVRPFVKRQKNDAADAEASCEAAQRPTMRFVGDRKSVV